MKRYELTGERFGRLVAVKYVQSDKRKKKDGTRREGKWLCACDCGMTTMVTASDLVHGRTRSCGCLLRETTIKRMTTHGGTHTRLFTIWYAMKQRCYYDGCDHRENYSMKGITVCDEWKNDFSAFRKWSYEHGYYEQPKGTPHKDILSIDRIDPDKGYSPDNCQWISCDENLRKRFTDKPIRAEVSQG